MFIKISTEGKYEDFLELTRKIRKKEKTLKYNGEILLKIFYIRFFLKFNILLLFVTGKIFNEKSNLWNEIKKIFFLTKFGLFLLIYYKANYQYGK